MVKHNNFICVQKFATPKQHTYFNSLTQPQRAIFQTNLVWPPGSTIRIYFMNNPTPSQEGIWWQDQRQKGRPYDQLYNSLQGRVDPQTLVKTIVKERFAPLAPTLKFVFTDRQQESDVRIFFDESGLSGSSSAVGIACLDTAKNTPTMYYSWLDVGTVIHEFGHVLGMLHELQNPRDNPILWDKPNALCYYEYTQGWDEQTVDYNVFDALDKESTNGSSFDPYSIMKYFFPATFPFPRDAKLPDNCKGLAGQTVNLTTDGKGQDANSSLSELDIEWINKTYNPTNPNPPTLPPTGIFNVADKSPKTQQFESFIKKYWYIFAGIVIIIIMIVLYFVV